MRSFAFKTLVILGAGLACGPNAEGAVALTLQDPGTNPFGGFTWTLGFEFSPTVDVNVTSLGFLDLDADGLGSGHDVALWDTGGNLLASTFIDNSDPLTGFYRFEGISPIQLTAGNNYVIAGHDYSSDDAIRDDQGVISTIHPDITVIDGRWGFPSGSIQFPPNNYSDPTQFFNTVSFEFNPVSEPVSSPFVFVGAMITIFGLARRQRI